MSEQRGTMMKGTMAAVFLLLGCAGAQAQTLETMSWKAGQKFDVAGLVQSAQPVHAGGAIEALSVMDEGRGGMAAAAPASRRLAVPSPVPSPARLSSAPAPQGAIVRIRGRISRAVEWVQDNKGNIAEGAVAMGGVAGVVLAFKYLPWSVSGPIAGALIGGAVAIAFAIREITGVFGR